MCSEAISKGVAIKTFLLYCSILTKTKLKFKSRMLRKRKNINISEDTPLKSHVNLFDRFQETVSNERL